MARQRIHNSRSGRGSGASGASWISYSDMMASLLLVFVLILCVSLYQYFTMLETKTNELQEKETQLAAQQTTLDEQTATMAAQQATLDEQTATMAAQQATLDEQAATLAQQQADLDTANASLAAREEELTTLQSQLSAQQTELDTATQQLAIQQAALAQKQTDLDTANASLAAREEELTNLQSQLSTQQAQLDTATQQLAAQQQALTEQTEKIDDLVGVRSEIIATLSTALTSANLHATVDTTTGDIQLDSAVFFETGSYKIKEEGRALLDEFIPVYLGVLLKDEYSDYLGEIIIEGHTDSTGSYLNNLELSQNRALAVAKYCLQMTSLTDEQRTLLRKILTATGRSNSSPVYNEDGTENLDASRRVEFKFSLRDAEMIEEMNRLLSGEE